MKYAIEIKRTNEADDWKRYKVKYHLNGYESKWRQFRSNEFWQRFRFTTPCEDWEIQAYGHIR